jgi:hypothetical protein
MNRIKELERRVRVQTEVVVLENNVLIELKSALRKAKAAEEVERRNIRLEDVELSSGDDRPWFKSFWRFRDWLIREGKLSKQYVEWNRQLHPMDNVLANKFEPLNAATIDDLK